MGNASSTLCIYESDDTCGYSFHPCYTRFATIHYVPASPGVYCSFQFNSCGEVYEKTRQCSLYCYTSLDGNVIYNGLCASSYTHHGNATWSSLPFSKSSRRDTCI